MIKKILALMACVFVILILTPVSYALEFDVEETYDSIVVVYTDQGVGSGFALGQNCVITNAHVIEGSKSISLGVYNDGFYKAVVIKEDADLDLAVLKIIGKDLPALTTVAEKLLPGDEVYAIGAPKEMPYTMTKGIVSTVNRKIGDYTYIQTDASINPGNSGGPLLNSNGDVIGVNTFIIENTEGIALSIPISRVTEFLDDEKVQKELNSDSQTVIEPINAGEENVELTKSAYINLLSQIESLKMVIIIYTVVVVIMLLLLIRKNRKAKDVNDFEIEIAE